MNIELEYSISTTEFLEMVESVGWNTYSKEQIDKALNNTMYMVKATVDGKLAGIGRIVGDFSIIVCWVIYVLSLNFKEMELVRR